MHDSSAKKKQIDNDNQMFSFLNAHKRGCYAVIKLIISKKKRDLIQNEFKAECLNRICRSYGEMNPAFIDSVSCKSA